MPSPYDRLKEEFDRIGEAGGDGASLQEWSPDAAMAEIFLKTAAEVVANDVENMNFEHQLEQREWERLGSAYYPNDAEWLNGGFPEQFDFGNEESY